MQIHHSALVRDAWRLVLESQDEGGVSILEQVRQRAAKVRRGLEHTVHDERLGGLC